MRKKLFKQIWNARWSNGWIFTELLIVFIAMWFVLDPLYTLLYQTKAVPLGFDPEKVYYLSIGENIMAPDEKKYTNDATGREQLVRDYYSIISALKSVKEISVVSPVATYSLWNGSMCLSRFKNRRDTTKEISAQIFSYYHGTDYFKIFRLKDARTKRWDNFDSISYTPNGIFINESAEMNLFGKGKGLGQEIISPYTGESGEGYYKVIGIVDNFINIPGVLPSPCVIIQDPPFASQMSGGSSFSNLKVAIRLADGVNESEFVTDFNNNISLKLIVGNLYVAEISSLDSFYSSFISMNKITSKVVLQAALALFFMINICLAVFATFWMRIEKRRSEIGLMMVIGSTKRGASIYFMLESLAIFGLAAVVGILIVIQIVYYKGLYMLDFNSSLTQFTYSFGPEWPISNYFAHFVIVTLIVLVLEGITVLFGTWFSARNVAKILPADALREE